MKFKGRQLAMIFSLLLSFQSTMAVAWAEAVEIPPAPPMFSYGEFYDAADTKDKTKKIFSYNPESVYTIYCRPGYVTDIALYPGDQVLYIAAGDTAQWMVDSSTAQDTPHIYVKPLKTDAQTNLIVNTDRHRYHVMLVAADWYNPIIIWEYRTEEEIAQYEADNRAQKQLPLPRNAQSRYAVRVQGKETPGWLPRDVWDDGKNTYIHLGDTRKELPILFALQEKGRTAPVQYKREGEYFIVNGILDKARLQSAQGEKVDIVRQGNRKGGAS